MFHSSPNFTWFKLRPFLILLQTRNSKHKMCWGAVKMHLCSILHDSLPLRTLDCRVSHRPTIEGTLPFSIKTTGYCSICISLQIKVIKMHLSTCTFYPHKHNEIISASMIIISFIKNIIIKFRSINELTCFQIKRKTVLVI